jgi:predicted DNA-binding mobile mystery protein A
MRPDFLRQRQLDSLFASLKHKLPARPPAGWIAEIRKALGMTTAQVSRRVGVDQSVISRLEQSETNDRIELSSLIRVAEALGCDVHYMLVPREPLEKQVIQRAMELLSKDSPGIEEGSVGRRRKIGGANDLQRELRAAELIQELGSRIWDE